MPDVGGARGVAEAKICSVTVVGNQVMLPETVRGPRMHAITAAVADTSPGTARSPRRSVSRCAIPAARPATWRETVTTPTSRSATPVAASATSRRAARRSSATGVEKLAMLQCTAVRPVRSTATTVASQATWPRSVPSRPRPSLTPPCHAPLLPLADAGVFCGCSSQATPLPAG